MKWKYERARDERDRLEQALTAEELKLAQLIVSSLNLEMQAAEIDPTAPLYGEGMGLDSIDILEVALRSPRPTASSCVPTTTSIARSSVRCAA